MNCNTTHYRANSSSVPGDPTIRLEYLRGWQAALLFLALAAPIVFLGIRSLSGLGPVRKWVAIAVRLAVLLLFILIIGGIRWQRQNRDVEVMVLRDISQSTAQVRDYPGKTLQSSIDDFLRTTSEKDKTKQPEDRIGVISFNNSAMIDAMPGPHLLLDARAIREAGNGTDVAAAIQLALATLGRDAMHRLVLIWDGNATAGDLEPAIEAAAAQHVPIDVMPLKYDVQSEVLVDRFVAPTWKRENEPFTIDVILKSTNAVPVTGKLTVLHQDVPMDLDPSTPGVQATRIITLNPGLNVEHVKVPALQSTGVHQFHAVFEGENVTASVEGGKTVDAGKPGDTLLSNNTADAFTFVRGKGQILYVDNTREGRGQYLPQAVRDEGIDIRDDNRVGVDQFPNNIVQLQNYDAIILANVPRGPGGLSEDQMKMLATYVHDMGGGLICIGGEDTFGAGGWQGSKLEEVLPVNMDIPAQRQMPKGALVLVMHSCEMPDGNYWGEQCAIEACKTLSERDEIGVISYAWGAGGSQWDFPLQEKGDGSKVISAIKKMQLGDMPSFDDSMNVALNGKNGIGGLIRSDAKQKHVIIISDGDPAAPNQGLVQQYLAAKVSVSTVSVYPHMGDPDGLPPTMKQIARDLKGRAYGPINNNPSQLPQIFIKEATVVRRSLIFEDNRGIPLKIAPSASEMTKGVGELPSVFGLVLTSKKNNPQIEMPIVAGKNNDPMLAHWQTGLGKAAVFTSDAHNKWAAQWVGSPAYAKFWAQVVRGVSRPPMSSDFDVQTTLAGDKGKISVEALTKDSAFLNFLSIRGTVVGPDMKPHDVRLVQTGPGTYTADFDTPNPGNYVVVLNYRGAKGEGGVLLSGVAMNSSPELRDLKSNEGALKQIAERTNGRVLTPFDTTDAELFTRAGLSPSASPLPVWDIMIPVLLALILLDVATRRIAWDWNATKRAAFAVADRVRAFTLTRKVESRQTLDALKRVREEVAETKFKPAEEQAAKASAVATQVARPDPRAKFQAKEGVEGDITKVVGGATDKPVPPPPKKIEPKGAPAGAGGHTGSLLEAKRRAQQAIKQKEQGQD